MKILYGIQTTGLGHIVRSTEIIKELLNTHEVDILLSGPDSHLDIGFPVKYRKRGLFFKVSTKGSIGFRKTFFGLNFFHFFGDILSLPLTSYDLVITDFEPISAWAGRLKGKKVLGIAHQYSYLEPVLRDKLHVSSLMAFFLKYFAICDKYIGLNFDRYTDNIVPAVIKSEIKNSVVKDTSYFVVYLPYHDINFLVNIFEKFPQQMWHIFSNKPYLGKLPNNVLIFKVPNEDFTKQLTFSTGLITTAGFMSPSECLFLGKKLLVIPLLKNPEQRYNATLLEELDVVAFYGDMATFADFLCKWLKYSTSVKTHYTDVVPEIISRIEQFHGDIPVQKK